MMKNFFYFFLFLIIIFVVGFLWYEFALRPVGDAKIEEIIIPKNTGDEEISVLLKKRGLIRSELAFRVYAFLSGKDKKIQPGTYLISSDLKVSEILDLLVSGKVIIFKVTIPEGLTIEGTDSYLAKNYQNYDFQSGDFIQAVKNYKEKLSSELLSFLPQLAENDLEGVILGDTYFLNKNDSKDILVAKIIANFQNKALPFFSNEPPEPLENHYQTLILASLVEQEAKTKVEKQLVAGIFLKRLENSDFLQSCASVNYLLPEKKEKLSYADLLLDSPYNTYQNKGLPPAPICNPSLESLNAVIHFKNSDYYYFLSDQNGKLHFSETLEDHNSLQQQIWGGV